MAVWSVSDRERNMTRKTGGREGEDETAVAASAAASSVRHKAEGQRLALTLSFCMTHISEKQGERTQVCVPRCALHVVHVFVSISDFACVCVAAGSPLCESFSFHVTGLPSRTQTAARATICAGGGDRVRG